MVLKKHLYKIITIVFINKLIIIAIIKKRGIRLILRIRYKFKKKNKSNKILNNKNLPQLKICIELKSLKISTVNLKLMIKVIKNNNKVILKNLIILKRI